METVATEAGIGSGGCSSGGWTQGRRTLYGHWSGSSWSRANKTLRDVRVTNIMIGVIRSNWDCTCKLLQEVHKVIYKRV